MFTTPDPARVEGHVTSTKPLLVSGAVITGLRVRFEGRRAVAIDADENAGTLRTLAARDEGAARLGEVALVDRESRIGQLGRVFSNTLRGRERRQPHRHRDRLPMIVTTPATVIASTRARSTSTS